MSIYARFEKHADKTFAEAAERYLREFQGKDERRPRLALDSVLPYIGHLRLIDVDDEALEKFKVDRANGTGSFTKPAMAGTTNKELTQVVTVMNKACRVWRWLPSAPAILPVKGKQRVPYPLTWEEQDRLFRYLPNGWAIGAALFAINTGVRKGELFGLKWEDEIHVPELDTFVFVLRDTKNGESRAVICNSLARKAVEHQRDNGSEYVFPSRSPGRNGAQIRSDSRVWINAWKRAGLPMDPLVRKGLHNARHSFGHRLRAVGTPQEDRNALLGHARTSLAEHYAVPDIERLLHWAEKITERRETTVLRGAYESKSRPT